jgi:hypothetical protein
VGWAIDKSWFDFWQGQNIFSGAFFFSVQAGSLDYPGPYLVGTRVFWV